MASRAVTRISLNRAMEGFGKNRISRYFSDGKGKILSEEERAAENVYIQRKEREKLEKLKMKAEKEKAAADKQKSDKKPAEDSHKG